MGYIPDMTERFPEGMDGVDMTPMYFGEPVDWSRALRSRSRVESKGKLNLADLSNSNSIACEYNIAIFNGHWVMDGDFEEMLSKSDIEIGEVLFKARDWKYVEGTGYLIGCSAGDYLETVELKQSGVTYLCQAFADDCGEGLDYTMAVLNVYAKEGN